MKVWGVTADDIKESAAEVGIRVAGYRSEIVRDGRALRFTLATSWPTSDGKPVRYGRRSQFRHPSTGNRRRIPGSVCWHGHRDFFRALYKRCPEARIKTAMADYRGAEDFERTHKETAHGTGGSKGSWLFHTVPIDQACDCGVTS